MTNRSFRSSFEALLNKKLLTENGFDPGLTAREKPQSVQDPGFTRQAGHADGFMDRRLASHLRVLSAPISKDIIRNLKKKLFGGTSETMRIRTADLDAKSGKAKRVAASLGLIAALKSDELRRFGERAPEKKLLPDPGCQVICLSPATTQDRIPIIIRSSANTATAMSTSISCCLRQVPRNCWSMKGAGNAERGRGNRKGMSIAVYQLPFWHTPRRCWREPASMTRGAGCCWLPIWSIAQAASAAAAR